MPIEYIFDACFEYYFAEEWNFSLSNLISFMNEQKKQYSKWHWESNSITAI